jgi:peptidoglycan/LPS O-acetylase OafA/YrhL
MMPSDSPYRTLKREMPTYRADIQGLRALAVLGVIAFHAGVPGLPGGFVGVDVFFVISGYLMHEIITGEMVAGRFSLGRFYARRLRRILPALVLTLVFVIVAGGLILYPQPYIALGKSMAASALFAANVYFWRDTGYFSAPAAETPLLHLWSLGVEAQFYLLFPLFLMLLGRWRLSSAWPLFWLAALSFAASELLLFAKPLASFYLLPTRIWEFLLPIVIARPSKPSRLLREAGTALGVGLVMGSMVLLGDGMRFPGAAALAPCLGAALVVELGRHGPTAAGRWLGARPMAFIGALSYSLYLYHWPVFTFYKLAQLETVLNGWEILALVALSALLSLLSWRCVETPFRRVRVRALPVFGLSAAACGAVVVAAVLVLGSRGLPGRFSPQTDRYAGYLSYNPDTYFRNGTCFISNRFRYRDFPPATCLAISATKRNVLLMGDSHAAHLYYGLQHLMPGINVLQATSSGCLPIVDPAGTESCRLLMRFIYGDFLPSHRVDLIVLSDYWAPADLARLAPTLDWAAAQGLPVAILGPVPIYDHALPLLLAESQHWGEPDLVQHHALPGREPLDDALRQLAKAHGVSYGSPYRVLCPGGRCASLTPDDTPVQFDYGHLTREGSLMVARGLIAEGVFDAVLPRPAATMPMAAVPPR